MTNRFNLKKTMQAVSAFLHFHGTKDMSYIRLLKLLYIADLESIAATGHPITGDKVVAMKHGPVLSGVYDLIKTGASVDWPQWTAHFQTTGYRIERIADPGVGSLSRFELGKIQELVDRYREKGEWEIVEETHAFPEWVKNNPGDSSKPIPLGDILTALGCAENEEAIKREAQSIADFDRLLAAVA